MRLKKIKLCFLFSVFFLSGCYNYHELSELSITTAIGIDKSENGYKLIAGYHRLVACRRLLRKTIFAV